MQLSEAHQVSVSLRLLPLIKRQVSDSLSSFNFKENLTFNSPFLEKWSSSRTSKAQREEEMPQFWEIWWSGGPRSKRAPVIRSEPNFNRPWRSTWYIISWPCYHNSWTLWSTGNSIRDLRPTTSVISAFLCSSLACRSSTAIDVAEYITLTPVEMLNRWFTSTPWCWSMVLSFLISIKYLLNEIFQFFSNYSDWLECSPRGSPGWSEDISRHFTLTKLIWMSDRPRDLSL